ncbi:hypothetical protein [Lichenibacterium dinghuense]|uniref:hypothetical protein n=1 Tax=Lichenibacterium dinghuense TaxID=2895977 RepID=UPI001F273AB3|nr:hypothetical protein [Lichenibacterium sp. 6Y81]
MSFPFGGCLCCGGTPSGMGHRRHFLKAAGVAMAGVALRPRSAFADAVPAIAYESVPDLVQKPPDTFLGECSGVAVNSKEHLFIFSRGKPSQSSTGISGSRVPRRPGTAPAPPAAQRAGDNAAISALSGLVEDITASARAALGLSIYPVGMA